MMDSSDRDDLVYILQMDKAEWADFVRESTTEDLLRALNLLLVAQHATLKVNNEKDVLDCTEANEIINRIKRSIQ